MLKIILKTILLFIISVPIFYYLTGEGLITAMVMPGVLLGINLWVTIRHHHLLKKENAEKNADK